MVLLQFFVGNIMKYLSIALLALMFSFPTFSYQSVNGYYKSNGTYVQGYTRSSPNSTVQDNYSYKGNSNPYTGETGSNYYRNDSSSGYYNGGSQSNQNTYNPYE